MAGGVFKGTNLAQDQRFGDATQKLMSQMTFGSQLKKRVDMSKVNMEVIKPWIASKIKEALGLEDEVLFEFVINMLEESNTPDPKAMQVNLTGFLESKTQEFMQSLWTLLLEAQKGLGGMPESLIRSKVEEIRRQPLLCNVLRVLSQAPTAAQTVELAPRLALRAHSALEWCLRVREFDSTTAEPFLGVCFRAYYALGASSGRHSLDIRLLGLVAYSVTKACDVRELLKYAARAATRAESLAAADAVAVYKQISSFYTALCEQAKVLLGAAAMSPELVEFCHHMAFAKRCSGDLAESLGACQLVARSGSSGSDVPSELVVCSLVSNCLVHHALTQGSLHADTLSAANRIALLAEDALGSEAKYTLTGWNTLALCADISRKAVKKVLAELRLPRLDSVKDDLACATYFVAEASDRIYEAYISRGAAKRAEDAGGTSVGSLTNCCAEVCLMAIQLALQCQKHGAPTQLSLERHSNRLLSLCRKPGCSLDFLRSHSTVFFNQGAGLYQLKIYAQAAQAMERAIASLSAWVLASVASGTALGDAFSQLCKRYEVAALAHQANRSYVRASQMFGQAVGWIATTFGALVKDAIMYKSESCAIVLPVASSHVNGSSELERLLMFIDRYVRMCQARLALDSSEPQALLSILDHMDTASIDNVVLAWLCEAEAYLWRPFVAPTAAAVQDVRAARLGSALKLYGTTASLEHARCLVELAKIDRDRGDVGRCLERLQAAMKMAEARLPRCIYSCSVVAECHAWMAVVGIESQNQDSVDVADCVQTWAYILQTAENGAAASQAGGKHTLDTGHMQGVVELMGQTAELLMSRRLYSLALDIQRPKLNISLLCECHDRSWAPVVMESLVELGASCLLLGQTSAAAENFRMASSRYEAGVLPVHVDIASKIAYASFQLACGLSEGGAETMREAGVLARSVLETGTNKRSARSKRPIVSPETMVLFSKASHAYSVLSLKQGALADAVDFGVHSYRILQSLLRSLSAAHVRARQQDAARSNPLLSDEDPFSGPKSGEAPSAIDESEDKDGVDCQFVAFNGNWELQRLLLDNLAHLAEIYSLRGSVKEAEYFLKKGLSITAQLQAPRQEGFMRLREADILARKNMWDECAGALSKAGSLRCEQPLGHSAELQAVPALLSAFGGLEALGALVVEGDSWRRCGKYGQAGDAYTQAQEMLGRMPAPLEASVNNDEVASVGSESTPLSVIAEDLATRQRLLAVLMGSAANDGLAEEESSSGFGAGGSAMGLRSIDQRPEHLLMHANLAFAELQRVLSEEEEWGSVLQSALMFPALRRPRVQRPRKGTVKALVKSKLGELDELLKAAAEAAITVGSAHCVHESCHLLALVRAMAGVFGLGSADSGSEHDTHRLLAMIVDDARNITAVREAIDVMRRKGELLPAALTRWPAEILQRNGGSGLAGGSGMPQGHEDEMSPSQSRLGLRRSNGGSFDDRLQLGRSGSPRAHSGLPMLLEFSIDGETDGQELDKSLLPIDRFTNLADGAKVVAGWTACAAAEERLLCASLPPAWVACGISVDALRNVLFITRYEHCCEPVVICLPLREIDLGPGLGDGGSFGQNVFGDLQQRLCGIISESDKSMKTGGDCKTEEEKRGWWENRLSLDRQLGALLQSIENEWLGGFKVILQPDALPSSSAEQALGRLHVDTGLLCRDIQQCVCNCLPKTFVAKAKAMELSDNLCLLILAAASNAKRIESGVGKDDDAGTGDTSDWLDVCSMLWDVFCYQGAAPASTEDDLAKFADRLLGVLAGYIDVYRQCQGRQREKRQQLVLILDKHAQQVPWECLPCLRDYPISRVPSVAFLHSSIASMSASSYAGSSVDGLAMPGLSGEFPLLGNPGPLFGGGKAGSTRSRGDLGNPAPAGLSSPMSVPMALLKTAAEGTRQRARAVQLPAEQISRLRDIPGVVADGSRVFYVLNPEGDLHRTQANFEGYLLSQPRWHGVIGRRPTPHECESGLSSSGIFMYFGHGGAENYISRAQIRGLRRCSVALLFGCSSGQLKPAGEYDAMGTAMDYMIGGCPALVGNLWDVGDKDIDRFAAQMLRTWGLHRLSPGEIRVKLEAEQRPGDRRQPVSLAEAVCEARKACRMSFLTGAAPVVYGIPVYLL
ncbi:separin protein [Coemansia sp. RSA 2322]|nr:separin protein [Coemansia sp. RSA 2322]